MGNTAASPVSTASTAAAAAAPGTVYDVIVVGGGMVGSALACALGEHGLDVALIEAEPVPPLMAGEPAAARVSAISAVSQRILARLGAWPAIEQLPGAGGGAPEPRVCAYTDMEVWDASGPGLIHFDAAGIGEPALGWIIENRVIQSALLARAATIDALDVYPGVAVTGFEEGRNALGVRLADGRRLSARLLVGADGAQSPLRAWAGIDTMGWGYEQQAVVCRVRCEQPHHDTCWQRFLPGGPLAFLPMYDGSCSIVWSCSRAQARQVLALDDAGFAHALGEAFSHRLGPVLWSGPRAAFPLRLQHAQHYVQPRVALVGDAAHVVHPLAGQGVNLGLLDAAALAELLIERHGAGQDIGAIAGLRRYERARKGDNLLMQAAMDGFKRLFGSPLAPVVFARNAGLLATNALGPLKHLFARRALGFGRELPALARPG